MLANQCINLFPRARNIKRILSFVSRSWDLLPRRAVRVVTVTFGASSLSEIRLPVSLLSAIYIYIASSIISFSTITLKSEKDSSTIVFEKQEIGSKLSSNKKAHRNVFYVNYRFLTRFHNNQKYSRNIEKYEEYYQIPKLYLRNGKRNKIFIKNQVLIWKRTKVLILIQFKFNTDIQRLKVFD